MKPLLAVLFRLPQNFLIGLVKGYRLLLSPSLGSACRFEPTCSAYSLQALQQYGAVTGTYLTLHRLGRCHPWCDGGFDPVPAPGDKKIALFSRLVTPVTSISSKKNPS
ncbi:MAG: membrane protein insertion efficiency factor YidD [Pseudomonadota bacterium]